MSLSRFVRKTAISGCVAMAMPALIFAQANFVTNGNEYAIAGTLPGDQVHPQLSLNTSGGYLVWEDNITDGGGLGICALRLDSGFSAFLSPFRVNQNGADDQENPQVALLNNGGAAFVWQGGRLGFQHIYARFLSSSGTWVGGDVLVNSVTNRSQVNPVLAALPGGNVVVAWASYKQQGSNSMQDVYAQILSPTGQKVGGEFLVNQYTPFNQRTPAIAALSGGGFAIAWVSEMQRSGSIDSTDPNYLYSPGTLPSVDIYARLYAANGSPVGNEFLVNTGTNVCANPSVAGASDGSFTVAWGERSLSQTINGWDIFARPFSSGGVAGSVVGVNTTLLGDQYAPQISALGTDYLVVWTSLDQDGSFEGVYGQFLRYNGVPAGGEFLVNTTTVSKQMHPAVTGDGYGRFLVAWTSFIGGSSSFDLFAQRYVNNAQPLVAMNAPFVYAPFVVSNGAYQPQIQVSWPFQTGLPIDHYEVSVSGASTFTVTVPSTTNIWLMTAANGLTPNSSNYFQVAFVAADGRRSPTSPGTGKWTWGGTVYEDSLPIEWVAYYYGYGRQWPDANAPVVRGGPTLLQVFLTGGNPTNAATWLRTRFALTHDSGQTYYSLSWNTQPGLTYQVQTSSNLSGWANYQSPRFAAGTNDSTTVPMNKLGYFRVLRLR